MITDVLIIGSGGAGLTAAIEAKQNGANVTVLSKTSPTASQTCQAQGGINACMDEKNDSIQKHIDDTLKSAHSIGNDETIKLMCQNAKETIQWLDNIAVPFSRTKSGDIAQRKLGGASASRACYSSDYTGLKILHTLYDTCLKENIEFIEDYMLLNFIVENGSAIGITALDITTTEVKQILAKNIIIATGGYSGIYTNFNTNSYATTGDGIAAALRAGCQLSNMEYIQFHPTALKDNCVLISESARGEGGYLVTKNNERVVDELKPRDEVARAIYTKIKDKEDVFLDLRHLGHEKIISSMPQEYELALQYCNLKMDKDLIPINPVAHYSMGGIKANANGQTNINNLYAIGECSNNGAHGANRLGGNSLLEIIVFGRLAGKHASENLNTQTIEEKEYSTFTDDKSYLENIFNFPNKINFYDRKDLLGETLYNDVGLFRTDMNLQDALKQLKQWQQEFNLMGINDKTKLYNTNLKEFIEFGNMLEIAESVTLSALKRCESRGAHYRLDYEKENKQFSQESTTIKVNNTLNVECK